MTKVIKKDDWDRKASAIKMIVENLQEKSADEAIIELVEYGKKTNELKIKLSESDIFLLYCKLIEAKRTSVIKDLRLVEDLADFEEEYIYETTYTEGQHNKPIFFPLLAYSVYNQIDWKDIAYIQQQKKIDNAANIQIEWKRNHWDTQLVKEPLLNSDLDRQDVFKKYRPFLMMGDVYVDFVTDKDGWSEGLRNAYRQFPEQVKEYLGYMAEQFNLTLALQSTLAGESETEEISKSTQDCLGSYAKALRNMVETVIKEIKDKRNFTQDSKRVALCEVSQTVLAHLDACDKKMLKVLEKKADIKLITLIETLRKNVDKVLPVAAYTDKEFFTPSSLGLFKDKLDKAVQTEEKIPFSPQIK